MSVARNKSKRMTIWRRPAWTTRRRLASTVLVASAPIVMLALLVGCTSVEDYDHYAIFDREPELADAPPPELADQEGSGVDIDTLRHATEYEGTHLYLATLSDSAEGICLVVDSPGDTGVTAACSGGSWVEIDVAGSDAYYVHPDSALPPPGYEDIAQNISVRTDAG